MPNTAGHTFKFKHLRFLPRQYLDTKQQMREQAELSITQTYLDSFYRVKRASLTH